MMKDGIELTGRNLEKWRRMRARGRAFYILVWGLACWGGLMFLVMGLGYPWLTQGVDALSGRWLLISAVIWAAGGLLFGVLTWHFNEKAFQKTLTNHGNTPA
jgi:hypothetical protein